MKRKANIQTIKRIVRAYDSRIIRWYSNIRFTIMRVRFLEEIDQYIPHVGNTLDLGCGFGLFSLYFAVTGPSRTLMGIDLNANRISTARRCAERLQVSNAEYAACDATSFEPKKKLACVYTLDLLHHLPAEMVPVILGRIYSWLEDDGILLIKDVDTVPAYKRWFTLALDRAMVGMEPIRYWSASEMIGMVEDVGFQAFTHEMRDVLPYPHRLYICRKRKTR